MSALSENSTGYKSFTATAAAIGIGVRVKVDSSGNISAASATEAWIGTAVSAIAASGVGTVRLRNCPGTHLFVVSASVTIGNQLFATASGKVDDGTNTGLFTGFVALTTGGADGDLIEAAPADDLVWSASANQAAATDATSTQTLANALRTALISAGIIKGAA